MPEIEGLQWITARGESYVDNLMAAARRYQERYGMQPGVCYAGEEAFLALTGNRNRLGALRNLRIEPLETLHRWTIMLCGQARMVETTSATAREVQYPVESEWSAAVTVPSI